MIGKKLAHYEIVEKIGAGGMGEVYRATDTKLGRDVALKLLPPAFSHDTERLARFDREARTLASLNHPNIAAIYGLELDGEQRFLVMELVKGQDLSERLRPGQLPQEEALRIARQIADGLEEAHERGIVHRDLKPANVKLTPEGRVKILDFGLARAYQGEAVDEGNAMQSPTITAAMTQHGMILGTAAYMAPEQAKGKTVDRRADLWAFGVILWEMLTGKRLFQGEDVSDTLAAVLRAEPDWTDLPGNTPPAVRSLLERCLERDPRKRLRDIGEARVQLERWTDDPSTLLERVPADWAREERFSSRWVRWPWLVAVGALTILALWGWWPRERTTNAPATRMNFQVRLPSEDALNQAGGVNVQVSPDGEFLAYLTTAGIYLRRFDQLDSRLLAGTEGATIFTFSPDAQWIAFTVPGKLKRVSVTGGAPVEICEALDSRGVAWLNESTLVFTPSFTTGLSVVSLQDGIPRELTTPDLDRRERSHRWPARLPDGQSVLYQCQFSNQEYDESEIRILSLGDGTSKTVYRGGTSPRYATTGHLLFTRDETVFAIPLDLQKRVVNGLAVPVVSGIQASANDQENDDGSAQFDVSPEGILVYRTATRGSQRRVGRLDLTSGDLEILTEPSDYSVPVLSPDEGTLAVQRGEGNEMDIYLIDLESRVETRFTLERGADQLGCWSDDSRILYWMRRVPGEGAYVILRRPADGSSPEEELYRRSFAVHTPDAASPDGQWLLLTSWGGETEWDIVQLPLDKPGVEPTLFTGGPASQVSPQFAPGGRWLSHLTYETGQWQFILRRFPDTGANWRVTGGNNTFSSRWTSDGSAIIVRDDQGFLRFPVVLGEQSVSIGRSQRMLYEEYYRNFADPGAAITAQGRYAYLFRDEAPEGGVQEQSRIVLVTDWFSELNKLVPIER